MSRLWAFLAVGLPVLADADREPAERRSHLPLAGRRRVPAGGAIPTRDTWTFTAAGPPWVDQQWGAQVSCAAVSRSAAGRGWCYPSRRARPALDLRRPFAIGRRRGSMRARGPAAPAAFVVAALGAGAAAAALRHGAASRSCSCSSPTAATHPRGCGLVPLIVAVWANLHGSFFLGPVVLGLAWLEDLHRLRSGGAWALVARRRSAAGRLRHAVRPRRLGVRRRRSRATRRSPRASRSGSRRRSGRCPGCCSSAPRSLSPLIARRGRPRRGRPSPGSRVFFVIGVVCERGVAWWALGAVARDRRTCSPTCRVPRRLPPASARTAPMRRPNVAVAGASSSPGIALLPLWRPTVPGTGAPIGVLGRRRPGSRPRCGARPAGRSACSTRNRGVVVRVRDARRCRSPIDSRIEIFPADVWRDYEAVQAGADGWAARLDSQRA